MDSRDMLTALELWKARKYELLPVEVYLYAKVAFFRCCLVMCGGWNLMLSWWFGSSKSCRLIKRNVDGGKVQHLLIIFCLQGRSFEEFIKRINLDFPQ